MALDPVAASAATAAAATLATSIATSTWGSTKALFLKFFKKRGSEVEADLTRQIEADERLFGSTEGAALDKVRPAIEFLWEQRLGKVLACDGGALADLRTLLKESGANGAASATGTSALAVGGSLRVDAKADGGSIAGVVTGGITVNPPSPGPAKA